MAIPAILLAAGRLALQGLSRTKIVKELGKKYDNFADSVLKDAAVKGAQAAKFSDKTGKPIKDFYKEMLPEQTASKFVAKEGIKKAAKVLGPAGVGAAGAAYMKGRGDGEAEVKERKKAKQKSPSGGQTIKENRRVVSETKLNKGGVIKANCGASMKPNRMSRS
jgi:hypothetical protein